MRDQTTITKQEFINAYNGVLLENSTIHNILSKETNLGFTTDLVLNSVKNELIERLFQPDEVNTSDENTDVNKTEDSQDESTESETESVDTKDTEDAETTENDVEFDDLDELD